MYKKRTKVAEQIASRTGQVAVLIDPEKSQDVVYLDKLAEKAAFAGVSYFFVGGSTVSHHEFEYCVQQLKALTAIPVVLFPGASHQVSNQADALLFLNLISGRNPDFLIGHQVAAAPDLHKMDLEIIPTAYILIDGGKKTSVQYVSQTTPIPNDQHSIALNTALAGKMMGNELLYFDAGSGASSTVPADLIALVKKETNSSIIVGGGIRSIEHMKTLHEAGANVVVIGNHIEENIDFLLDIQAYTKMR